MRSDTHAALSSSREALADEIANGLAQFYGGDELYRHMLGIRYTTGVRYLAERAGAYWLIDAIASYQSGRKVRNNRRLQEFQLWELTVDLAARSCVLTCKEDSGEHEKPVITQEIEYTDFPLDYIKLYMEDGVLLLPSEH